MQKILPVPAWFSVFAVHLRTLFVHGSLAAHSLELGGGNLTRMNAEVMAWLQNGGGQPGQRAAAAPEWFSGGDSPMWSRLYSEGHPLAPRDCIALQILLREIGVERMVCMSVLPAPTHVTWLKWAHGLMQVVGHTVRAEGISAVCGDHCWRIDVGLASTESCASINY